jgi:hypothetical protein
MFKLKVKNSTLNINDISWIWEVFCPKCSLSRSNKMRTLESVCKLEDSHHKDYVLWPFYWRQMFFCDPMGLYIESSHIIMRLPWRKMALSLQKPTFLVLLHTALPGLPFSPVILLCSVCLTYHGLLVPHPRGWPLMLATAALLNARWPHNYLSW